MKRETKKKKREVEEAGGNAKEEKKNETLSLAPHRCDMISDLYFGRMKQVHILHGNNFLN
jgi:fructose-1,6-bisphosphatase